MVTSEANDKLAELPPRGWNSYDSFSWTVDENAYMQNVKILAEKLLPHGYQYAVIDFLWYRRYVDGAYTDSYGFDNIDEWGRPFPDLQRFPSSKVKVDCIFGTDYSPKEIVTISELLQEIDRPIVVSISPGTEVTVALAENISEHVNMYRITGDDWDNWKDVCSHFTVSSAFAAANKIGATGLRGRSWPDLDMLPFGWLTDPSNDLYLSFSSMVMLIPLAPGVC